MSTRYVAVTWNRKKRIYDSVVALGILGLVGVFMVSAKLAHPSMTVETGLIRGLGLTAFVLLHVILCIGPLCRLNPALLPLLTNRRHLGVAMCLIALAHAGFAVFQFHALGDLNPLLSLLVSNTAFGSVAGFPFELLGLAALVVLVVMAATSHDFWLSVLTPPAWKALHMLVYVAYALLIGHVSLGVMQAEAGYVGPLATAIGAALVIGLHLAAALRERPGDRERESGDWIPVCRAEEIPESRARIALVGEERVAVFRHQGRLNAVSNVCKHQNGPLGEGRIVDGCITCPWHGYQYRPEDGTSPPPFDDRVATFQLRVERGIVLVSRLANAPGTFVEPVRAAGKVPPVPAVEPGSHSSRITRRAVAMLAGLAAGTVAVLGVAQEPFAESRFEYGSPRELTGRIVAAPYPRLEVSSATGIRQYLLAAAGKHGAASLAGSHDGRIVRLQGTLAQRGAAALLEVDSLAPLEAQPDSPRPVRAELGRFSLRGEIVDSKCWTGVMNPGDGKTHLACAVRCLSGGLPPLLVLRDSAGRERHLILTEVGGGPMPRAVLHAVGRPVRVSGLVTREGALLFLRASPDAIQVLER